MPLLKSNDFWKPNTYYYATDRYKSLIEKDNTLYICNESHLSQDEFDVSKFVGISGSGGADLSERYAGEWDLNAGGSAYLVEAFPDPTKSTGYITVSNDVFRYLGDNTPFASGSSFYDYVVADGASPVNSGIRSMKVDVPLLPINSGNSFTMFGILNNTNTVADLIGILLGTPSTVSGFLFILGRTLTYGYTLSAYIINNGVPDMANTFAVVISSAVVGEPIYFDFNTGTGAVSVSITGDPDRIQMHDRENNIVLPSTGNFATLSGVLDLANFTTDTFAPYYGVMVGANNPITDLATFTFDLGTTDDGRLPFLSSQQVIEPPLDAVDGKVYKVVGNGVYLSNPPIYSGDYVEFSENIQTLIVNRLAKTDAQLNNFILDVIDAQTQTSGLIGNAIKAKTSGHQSLTLHYGEVASILPDTFYVEIVATDDSTLLLPSLNSQYTGKRLLIYSTTSGLLTISFWGSLITEVNEGDVFEFVAVKPTGSLAKWIRVK